MENTFEGSLDAVVWMVFGSLTGLGRGECIREDKWESRMIPWWPDVRKVADVYVSLMKLGLERRVLAAQCCWPMHFSDLASCIVETSSCVMSISKVEEAEKGGV